MSTKPQMNSVQNMTIQLSLNLMQIEYQALAKEAGSLRR